MSEATIQDENSVNTEQNPMVNRIALETKRREPSTINELVLDNCARCHSIQGLTEDFCNLRMLSIINVGLQSLAKFPALPKLRKLYLSDNRLSSGLENLQGCSNLSVLVLAGNKFKSVDELKPLVNLPKLTALDLMNCEVTSTEGYRDTVFNMLPQLKFLDNIDKEGVERDSEDEDDEEEEEDAENGDDDDEEEGENDDDEDDDDYEEEDNKTSLKALYNGTFEDGDDDEESYQGNEDEEESDEEDDLSEGDVSADPVEETAKGEKRKRDDDNEQDDNGPPQKV